MKKAIIDDQDNKGGKNYDWISAQCTSTSEFKRSSVVFADNKVQIGKSAPLSKIVELIEKPLEGGVMNWNQARDSCEAAGSKLATAAQLRDFLDKPISGDYWAPVGDAENDWMQIGERTSRGGQSKDFGKLHQDMDDTKDAKLPSAWADADGRPNWGRETNQVNWRKNYCYMILRHIQVKKHKKNQVRIVAQKRLLLLIQLRVL